MNVCAKSFRLCRELGPSSGWTPSGCGGPATRANSSSLVGDVWGMSWPTRVEAYSCRLVCACLKSTIERASGAHATIEGSDVSERRLSSRCRSAWDRPIVLFGMG